MLYADWAHGLVPESIVSINLKPEFTVGRDEKAF